VVHGGIVALLFDDCMGFGFWAMGVQYAVTANLSVDYRAPVPADSRVLVRVRLSKQEGRKLYFTAQMTNLDGSVLYAEATSLYIIPRHMVKNS
jgi:acyl-coenzyme A thioesterase PaaI-like protein